MTQRFAPLLPLVAVAFAYFALFTCALRKTTASIPGTHVELVGVISTPNVALSTTGMIAANGDDGRIHFMRANGDELCRSQIESDGHFAMSADGRFVVAAGKDNRLHWIDPANGNDTRDVPFVHTNIRSFVLSGNGHTLAIAAVDHDMMSILVFDAVSGKRLYRSDPTTAQDKGRYPLTFDPTGRFLVVGGNDSLLRLDTEKWNAPKTVTGVFGGVDPASSPSGDHYVRRSTATGAGGPEHELSQIVFTNDGKYLMACADNCVTVLDRRTGRFSPVIKDKLNFVAVGSQANPNVFWLVTEGGTFKTLDPITLKWAKVQETSAEPWGTCSAARSSDGSLYVTGIEGGRVTFTSSRPG